MLVLAGLFYGPDALADEDNAADPTQLSPQITELLNQLQPPAVPAAEDSSKDADEKEKEEPFLVRLKGIVMRDAEHGSALLAIDKDQYIRVPLKRANARDEPYQLSLNGMNYEIESFSSSSLKLKNMNNGQVLIIN